MRVEVAQVAFLAAKWNLMLVSTQAANPEATDLIALLDQAVTDMNTLGEGIGRLDQQIDALEGENASLQAELIAQDGNDVET